MILRIVSILSIAIVLHHARADENAENEDPLSHGFGDSLPWVKWESARDLAKMQNKPVMVLIHKTWCGACQALKKKFQQKSAQQQLGKLAKYFVISNTADDEEPWEEEFHPDGKYIPRIIFTSPDGEVLHDIVNEKADYGHYKYYYTNPAQIMDSMRKVMEKYGLGEAGKKAPVKDEEKIVKVYEDGDEEEELDKEQESSENKSKEDDTPKPPSSEPPPAEPPSQRQEL